MTKNLKNMYKNNRIYNITRFSALVLLMAVLLFGTKSFSVNAQGANQIDDPASFCRNNLKGTWNGPDRSGNFYIRGECSTGKNCRVQIRGGIPNRTGCDVTNYDELWHKNPIDIMLVLGASSNGLPDGVTIPTNTAEGEDGETPGGAEPEAETPANTGSTTTGSPELDDWLQNVINLFSMLVGLVVVISIIFAGIQYMTAGGNASQVAAAKNRISMSVLAFILFAFTYALLQWLIPGGIFN
jgi:hypothetical protein